MSYCELCGLKFQDSDLFCSRCGRKISAEFSLKENHSRKVRIEEWYYILTGFLAIGAIMVGTWCGKHRWVGQADTFGGVIFFLILPIYAILSAITIKRWWVPSVFTMILYWVFIISSLSFHHLNANELSAVFAISLLLGLFGLFVGIITFFIRRWFLLHSSDK